MNSDPLVSARIRSIQSAAAARRKKQEEAAAKTERKEEIRQTISPRDVERAAAHKAACDFWTAFHEREELEAYHSKRRDAIAEMARLKAEWSEDSTSQIRRGQILKTYGEIYRRYEDDKTRKPTTTSDETILAYWKSEKRKAALARIYSGVTA